MMDCVTPLLPTCVLHEKTRRNKNCVKLLIIHFRKHYGGPNGAIVHTNQSVTLLANGSYQKQRF